MLLLIKLVNIQNYPQNHSCHLIYQEACAYEFQLKQLCCRIMCIFRCIKRKDVSGNLVTAIKEDYENNFMWFVEYVNNQIYAKGKFNRSWMQELSPPELYSSAWHHILWEKLLANLDQLPWFCLLLSFCAPQTSLLVGQHEKCKSPWVCSASNNRISVLQYCFQNKSKTLHLWRKWTPS